MATLSVRVYSWTFFSTLLRLAALACVSDCEAVLPELEDGIVITLSEVRPAAVSFCSAPLAVVPGGVAVESVDDSSFLFAPCSVFFSGKLSSIFPGGDSSDISSGNDSSVDSSDTALSIPELPSGNDSSVPGKSSGRSGTDISSSGTVMVDSVSVGTSDESEGISAGDSSGIVISSVSLLITSPGPLSVVPAASSNIS